LATAAAGKRFSEVFRAPGDRRIMAGA